MSLIANIRNFLYPMSLREMRIERDSSDCKIRADLINNYIDEVIAEEGVCVICGDFADGTGTDMCCDCMGE